MADERCTPVTLVLPERTAIHGRGVRRVIRLWAFVRLPLLAVVVYMLRHPILNFVEGRFDIFHITRFVIDLLSTPVMRFACAAALFGALLALAGAVRRLRLEPVATSVLVLLASSLVLVFFLTITSTSPRRGLLVGLVLWMNLAPASIFNPLKRFPRAWSAVMLTGVAIIELFCFREYWGWLQGRRTDTSLAGDVPGLLLASLAFAVLVGGGNLLASEQMIRMPAEAQVIERGRSFNGIELDPTGAYLYATGHGVPHLRRYGVADLAVPPLTSDVATGGAQGFAYDPRANELYAYNTRTHQLLFFDGTTLEVTRSIELPELSPGDPWVAVDPISNTLTIVSEADDRVGMPFIVLDRASGRVLQQENLDAGNVLMHPRKPDLYLSFFRRRHELMVYDLRRGAVAHTAGADSRSERLVFWAEANEVLVTSPMESRILRFDADDLRPKGHIPAPFGARAIALDEARQLLLCGTLATGYLVVMDVRTGRRLRHYYLGPWLRTIAVDARSGIAYVSSNGALYRLAYATTPATE